MVPHGTLSKHEKVNLNCKLWGGLESFYGAVYWTLAPSYMLEKYCTTKPHPQPVGGGDFGHFPHYLADLTNVLHFELLI